MKCSASIPSPLKKLLTLQLKAWRSSSMNNKWYILKTWELTLTLSISNSGWTNGQESWSRIRVSLKLSQNNWEVKTSFWLLEIFTSSLHFTTKLTSLDHSSVSEKLILLRENSNFLSKVRCTYLLWNGTQPSKAWQRQTRMSYLILLEVLTLQAMSTLQPWPVFGDFPMESLKIQKSLKKLNSSSIRLQRLYLIAKLITWTLARWTASWMSSITKHLGPKELIFTRMWCSYSFPNAKGLPISIECL